MARALDPELGSLGSNLTRSKLFTSMINDVKNCHI